MKNCLAFLGMACMFSFHLQAQSLSSIAAKSISKSLEEKVRVHDLSTWAAAHQQHQVPRRPQEPGTIRPSVLMKNDTLSEVRISSGGEAESEVHAAINPADTSNLIVAAMRQDPNNITAPLVFPTYYSTDFGHTWQLSSFQGAHPGGGFVLGGGDPVIAFESNGKAHLTWLLVEGNIFTQEGSIGLYYAQSADSGQTWTVATEPVRKGQLTIDLLGGGLEVIDRLVDKQWMAVDRSGGPFHDQLYMAYFEAQVDPDTALQIVCQRKTAAADTFISQPVLVSNDSFIDVQFTSMDVGPDGAVHISFWASYDAVDYSLYHARSIDGGASFLPVVEIAPIAFPPRDTASGFPVYDIVGVDRLYPCPHLKADNSNGPYSGHLYTVWTAYGVDSQETQGFDIYLSKSMDNGATWSSPVVVNNDTGEVAHQFFPSLEVSADGKLLVSWYDRRGDIANVNTHYYLAISEDGGASFENQFPVSSLEADFSQVGSNNNGFGIGEYTQVISSSGYAIPVWADGRENNGEVNLYSGFIPLNEGMTTSLERSQTLSPHWQLLSLFPNPALDQIHLELSLLQPASVQIRLFQMEGKQVMHRKIAAHSSGTLGLSLPLESLSPGIYLLQLQSRFGYITRKVVVH